MRAADSLTNQTQAAAVPASWGRVRTCVQSPQQLDRKARPQETRIGGAQEPCKGTTRKDSESEWPEKPSEDTHTVTTCCHRRANALCTHYTCTHCVYTQPGLYDPTEQSFSNSSQEKRKRKVQGGIQGTAWRRQGTTTSAEVWAHGAHRGKHRATARRTLGRTPTHSRRCGRG